MNGRALPGLALAAAIAAAATAIPVLARAAGEPLAQLPLSPILFAILLGLACAGLARRQSALVSDGLKVASGPLLKLAVMLIGLRLSLGEVATLGAWSVPIVLVAVICGLSLAWLLGRLLRVGTRLVGLLAVGSAICGASAIGAAAPALRARPEETAYALACIALFGLLATLAAPWLLASWSIEGIRAGLVLGASIHDTAQVTAAALLYEQAHLDPTVLGAATVTKLLRNLMMLIVIPGVAWWVLRDQERHSAAAPFPLFIIGFIAFAGLRSIGDGLFPGAPAWGGLLHIAAMLSAFLFAMAMAAIGMGIRLEALRQLGWRPAALALLTALGIFAATLAATGLLVPGT